MPKAPSIPLPRRWPRLVKSALLHAIGLERLALAEVRAGFENSPDPRAELVAALDRAREEIALLEEENRILRSRIESIAPAERPHYPPAERFAILSLKARRCWSAAQTARRSVLATQTIANWMRRLHEQGPHALVQTPVPVNRYDDAVTLLVKELHQVAPQLGCRKTAEILGRAGLHLGASTVRRMRKKKPPAPRPPPGEPEPKTTDHPGATDTARPKSERSVTAKCVHHVWHVDFSAIPIITVGAGFWAAWWPFALILQWALSWHLALVLDQYSRSLLAFGTFRKEPTAPELCAVLDRAVGSAGWAPKYLVSDRGTQFGAAYRTWCAKTGVKPRFGAIGKHGSIAILERMILSLKAEFLRRIFVPYSLPRMQQAMASYQVWYNEFRPHSSLGGRTPAEVRDGRVRERDAVRIEPRARYPLARAGPDEAPPAVEPARGRLELMVSRVNGYRELPIVELRQAA
jgi:transposase InsO family protein